MEAPTILPVLDSVILQEKANEFAMKGAIESIKEFYSGDGFPYRKAIDKELLTKSVASNFDLPDIVATINDSLAKQIDIIANEAISKTFIPMVHRFLTRAEKEMKFSDILKGFIENIDSKEYEECSVEVNKNDSYGWLNVELSGKDRRYKLTLHEDWETKKEHTKKYQLLSLPYDETKFKQTMKLTVEGGTLELPFTKDILQDNFMSFIARLVIANTKITMDCEDFSEEMFPQDECHCN